MMRKLKGRYHRIIKNATSIASTELFGAQYVTDFDHYFFTCYRLRGGKYCVTIEGGARVANSIVAYLDEDDARQWVADYATDAVTGFGYSDKQINDLFAGRDPGRAQEEQSKSVDAWFDEQCHLAFS